MLYNLSFDRVMFFFGNICGNSNTLIKNVLYGFRSTPIWRHKKRKTMPNSSHQSYSETFKLEVLRDYYTSGMSTYVISKKWGIPSHSTLFKWIRKYPLHSESLSLPSELLAELEMKKEPKSREEVLEEEILRLQKALELEKLRSHAFKKLIELTETEEKISILKKGGAK